MPNQIFKLFLKENKTIVDYCNIIMYWNSLNVNSSEFRYAFKISQIIK